MTTNSFTRRAALGGIAAGALAASLPRAAFAAKPVTVGFIYAGPRDDYGYNQAHAEGAAALKKLADIKVVEEETVAAAAVEKSMEGMIGRDDASLLFPTSPGYASHMVAVAQKHPKVQIRQWAGAWNKARHPANAGAYVGYIDECQYLSGIVAGHTSKTGKLGIVAARPVPLVLRNINAFALGARAANPSLTTQVIFTGDGSAPAKEAEATNSLIAAGVDVVTCQVDSPKIVIETAERAGVFTCGFHVNQAALAPKGYLTGSEWNLSKLYTDLATALQNDKPVSNSVHGGLKAGFVKMSAYGAAVTAAARKHTDDVKNEMTTKGVIIFKGPMRDNKGNTVILPGRDYAQDDDWIDGMNWLVQGVIGSTT